MEQHPVPQNVTTFQFRLIGDMTIKQFGYLAGGAILAYICYKLPLPFFFTWPMATIAALAGVGFAFVPVEERPMDIWVMSFIKNVYNPTQFVWEKTAEPPKPAPAAPPAPRPVVAPHPKPTMGTPAPSAVSHAQPQAPAAQTGRQVSDVVAGIFTQPKPTQPMPAPVGQTVPTPAYHPSQTAGKKVGPFDWLVRLFAPAARPATSPQHVVPYQSAPTSLSAAPSISAPSVTGRHLDLTPPPKVVPTETQMATVQKKETELETKLQELKVELETKTQTQARVLELQKQLTDMLSERDRMRKELEALRAKAAPPPAPTAVVPPKPADTNTVVSTPPPQTAAAPQRPQGPTVKIITPQEAVKAGLPRLTTFPNVVTGITRDSDNNLLPGVLVTVKDHDGVPVRALKTNRLGQFAASTPLGNGVYFVEIEDPRGRYTFDRVQITLNGSIVPALEIIAKSQKEVARERLAKEIFGS